MKLGKARKTNDLSKILHSILYELLLCYEEIPCNKPQSNNSFISLFQIILSLAKEVISE